MQWSSRTGGRFSLLLIAFFLSGCSVIGDVIEQAFDVDEWFDDTTSDDVVVMETSWVALSLNLDSRSDAPVVAFDPEVEQSYNVAVDVMICDSLGVVHPVRVNFLKVDVDTWEYHVVVSGNELGLETDRQVQVSQPSMLRFDPNGELAAEAGGSVSLSFEGAVPQAITFGFVTADASVTTQRAMDSIMTTVEGDGCGGEPLTAVLHANEL
jgi:hypothetical protein